MHLDSFLLLQNTVFPKGRQLIITIFVANGTTRHDTTHVVWAFSGSTKHVQWCHANVTHYCINSSELYAHETSLVNDKPSECQTPVDDEMKWQSATGRVMSVMADQSHVVRIASVRLPTSGRWLLHMVLAWCQILTSGSSGETCC